MWWVVEVWEIVETMESQVSKSASVHKGRRKWDEYRRDWGSCAQGGGGVHLGSCLQVKAV